MKQAILLSFIIAFVTLTACKKESAAPTQFEILTAKPWKTTGHTTQANTTSPVIDQFTSMQDCDKDDKFVYMPDSTFLQMEGPSKCDPAGPDIRASSTFRFSDDGLTLFHGSFPSEILKLTRDSLVFLRQISGGTTHIFRYAPY